MPKLKLKLSKAPKNAFIMTPNLDISEDYLDYSNKEVLYSNPKLINKINRAKAKEKSVKKTIFIEEFCISEANQPLEISLKKIPDETLPLEAVKIEVQNGYDRGFDDGQQVGRSFFETEIQKQQEWIKNFDSVTIELRKRFVEEINKLEDSVIDLSLLISEHILEKEIEKDPNIVIEQVRKAINMLKDDTIFKIHIHPDNYEILNKVKSSLISDKAEEEQLQIIPNNSVDKLGCILETSAGIIDSRIKKQLEKVQRSFLNISTASELEEDFENKEE